MFMYIQLFRAKNENSLDNDAERGKTHILKFDKTLYATNKYLSFAFEECIMLLTSKQMLEKATK